MQNAKSKKTLLIIFLLSLVVLGGAYAGYREYVSFRQARLIRQARRYLAKSDLKRAQLCLRAALLHNSKDLTAWRLMGQVAEASRSPSALQIRHQVVELNPSSVEDRLALARTATMLRDFAYAARVLDDMPMEDKKTAAFQNAAGEVAAAAHQFPQAEVHFLEAARLEPTNVNTQLNLDVVRLHVTNTTALTEARTSLKHMAASAENPTFRWRALRELSMDAVLHKQMDAALSFSRELLRQSNSVFEDRLLLLDVLQETHDAGFKPALATCQHDAMREQTNILEMAAWEMERTTAGDALGWLRSLPPQTQTNQLIALKMAECMTKLGDWAELQTFLDHQNWGDLDFLRHAFEARALRGQDLTASSAAQWEQALKFANTQEANLAMLLNLAAQWKWQTQGEEILWIIVNNYPGEKSALRALTAALVAGGRTRSLMQLFSLETKRTPSDLAAKNNMAMTALLLDEKELKPLELAREVYQKDPTNALYASTYALALHLRTNNTEALKVLEQLNPRELERPSISGCYGIVLQSAGQPAKARKYLDLTSKAMLLPEEKQLIERAKSGI